LYSTINDKNYQSHLSSRVYKGVSTVHVSERLVVAQAVIHLGLCWFELVVVLGGEAVPFDDAADTAS